MSVNLNRKSLIVKVSNCTLTRLAPRNKELIRVQLILGDNFVRESEKTRHVTQLKCVLSFYSVKHFQFN